MVDNIQSEKLAQVSLKIATNMNLTFLLTDCRCRLLLAFTSPDDDTC